MYIYMNKTAWGYGICFMVLSGPCNFDTGAKFKKRKYYWNYDFEVFKETRR